MISARMIRPAKVLLVLAAAGSLAACGQEKVQVPQSQNALHSGAVLFSQRCAGCHTLSYAATHGSAANVHTAQYNNGPNFDQRCERPLTRVIYAIENGGFSGAIMPQNIVTGQDAVNVAKFVATYSGTKAPKVPGVIDCSHKPIGTIPALAVASATTPTTSTTTTTARAVKAKAKKAARSKARHNRQNKT
jgi:cytochrome c551